MVHRVGDSIFGAQGVPGVVTKKHPQTGALTVSTQGEKLKETQKRGYVNGLTPADRTRFNEVVDQMRELTDPNERISMLTEKMHELEKDPRNHVLVRYIKAELAHTMSTYRIHPKEYLIDERYSG